MQRCDTGAVTTASLFSAGRPGRRLKLRSRLGAAVLAIVLAGVAAAAVVPRLADAAPMSAAQTRQLMVQTARGQLGTGEHPDGSNCTKYSPVCESWCSDFLTWVWRQAGIAIPRLPYSGDVSRWAKARGQWLSQSQRPQPGDAVLWGGGDASSNHVGLVVAVSSGGWIESIDGNWGNHVTLRSYYAPWTVDPADGPIYGFASPLPLHAASSGDPTLSLGSRGSAVVKLQKLLHITADGVFGPKTRAAVMAFQRAHHLTVDGVVGPQTWHALLTRAASAPPAHPKPASNPVPPTVQYGSRGPVVTRLQRALHITADGIFGPQTRAAVIAFQRRHHLAVDGIVGPQTWHALGF